MSATIGNRLRLTIFGESHQKAVGGVIDNLPAGITLDMDYINAQMKRRAPSDMKHSTTRKETDEAEIISGYFNDVTTGAPLAFFIKNRDAASKDYEKTKDLLRPGHADYSAFIRYEDHNDYRGGGHFSGRLTAVLVFAGAIVQQLLLKKGIGVISHISSIENVRDEDFDKVILDSSIKEIVLSRKLPVINEKAAAKMIEAIEQARQDNDSVGGTVECAVTGLKAGLGEPFFDSMESRLSHMIFSVPAVKGIEFGDGFDISKMRGSSANDQMRIEKREMNNIYTHQRPDQDREMQQVSYAIKQHQNPEKYYADAKKINMQDYRVTHLTNHNGGITGGITNGMPIIFRVAVKPTPSISKLQQTVNKATMKNEDLLIKGRHDACIVPRIVPVIEACAAFTVLDMLVERGERFEG